MRDRKKEKERKRLGDRIKRNEIGRQKERK